MITSCMGQELSTVDQSLLCLQIAIVLQTAQLLVKCFTFNVPFVVSTQLTDVYEHCSGSSPL